MSIPLASLAPHPSFMENTSFIISGFVFVLAVLAILSVLTVVIGKTIQQLTTKKPAANTAASVATPPAAPVPVKPSVPGDLPEHVLALITAATHVVLEGRPQRIVGVRQVGVGGWAQEGRREIFSSHRIR